MSEIQQQYRVTRDGTPLTDYMTHDQCWLWIHKHQPMSVFWATTYEGYAIEPMPALALKPLSGTEHYLEAR